MANGDRIATTQVHGRPIEMQRVPSALDAIIHATIRVKFDRMIKDITTETMNKEKESRRSSWYSLLAAAGSPVTIDRTKEEEAKIDSFIRQGSSDWLRIGNGGKGTLDKVATPKAIGKRKWGTEHSPTPGLVGPRTLRPRLQLASFSHEPQLRIVTPREQALPNRARDFILPKSLESTMILKEQQEPSQQAVTMECTKEDIALRLSNKIDLNIRWMEMFNLLLSYKEKHDGSMCVPLEVVPLGPWVRMQRLRYSNGTLPEERKSLLESIAFEWKKGHEEKWMEMYQRLVAYKLKYKSTCVPKRYKDDPQLGIWVRYQRQSCKDKDRIRLLNAIGFQWVGRVDTWKAMYQRLVAYKAKYNTTLVPERYKEDPQLGLWVHHQRQCCKDKDRIDLLNSIGFHWDVRTDNWMEMYQLLIAYKQKHNTTRVPRGDSQLGLWVFTQRQCCKQPYRVGLLNAIGFEWNARADSWKEMYQRLVAYKKEFNTTQVPQSDKKDPKLARWVHNQRRSCKDKDRIDLLNALGFQWSLGRKDSWMEMYQRLVKYEKEHKTTHVPNSFKGDPQLARWAYNQRRSCKEKGRIDLLNAIGFDWKSQQSRVRN